MEEPKPKRKLLEKLKDRYRLVVLREGTLEDVWYTVLTRMNILVWLGTIIMILIALGIVMVSFTPLREYIPGYPDGNMRKMLVENALKVDSLEDQLRVRDQYIENVRFILRGKESNSYSVNLDTLTQYDTTTENYSNQDYDTALYRAIDDAERYHVSAAMVYSEVKYDINKLHFFRPLQGTITSTFDTHGNHYGIDIVSSMNEPVLSVLEGTVTLTGWTLEAGYIIQVQHSNNLISIYKHNSQLLKKMGDRVLAGEPIAIIGNTGEYSTGPHLHFELWHQGKPLNPRDYIVF